jgi:hypothetical protein
MALLWGENDEMANRFRGLCQQYSIEDFILTMVI